jgi:hypothetical protein
MGEQENHGKTRVFCHLPLRAAQYLSNSHSFDVGHFARSGVLGPWYLLIWTLRAMELGPPKLRISFMDTMRKFALLSMLFFCAGSIARAGIRAADYLTWISDHLQTVSYMVTTPRATYPEVASAKMEFDGCNVKIVEDLKTQKSNIQTTVSFNLSYVQTDMVRSMPQRGYADTRVTPYFLVELPLVNTATNTTTFTASDGSKTETAESTSVSILFQDRDLANRQAKAWRDAAFACGARESISAP